VHILWNTTVTQRLTRVIDDSVYMREFMQVQAQLASARQKTDKDSIAFYLYETNYMKTAIDSVTKAIAEGDTTHRYGYLIGCGYFIRRFDRAKFDSTIVFIDTTSTMRFTEFMDSSLRRTIKMMN
jgi:hypothetical protein